MIAVNAHFDGKVLVPDEPLSLPANQKVRIQIEPLDSPPLKPDRVLGQQRDLITHIDPDWDAPLPDDIWDHNKDVEANP